MEWKDVDWQVLRTLRDRFLNPAPGDYWLSQRELEHYDLAFAPRIGAKWQEIAERLAKSVRSTGPWEILDWGCGTGIASRVLVEAVGAEGVEKVSLWDRSPLARRFAAERLGARGVSTSENRGRPPEGRYLLLISHVANELDAKAYQSLRPFLDNAAAWIWLEPGTPSASQRLIEEREKRRADWEFVLPCPHSSVCGLVGNSQDWCHQFAAPPSEFFTQSEWVHFGKEMGIDLRSLPVSFLAAAKPGLWTRSHSNVQLGRASVSKSHAKALVCDESGVRERSVRVHSKKEGDRYRGAGLIQEWKEKPRE
ncbi:small ribosomal subunit Rsm22 family protein [bacterium]|nr:small ribosomal subunit Rsm22 family protein [bacterium]